MGGTQPLWADPAPPADVPVVSDEDRLDVAVRDGFVYVTVARPVVVRVYSILGQLIVQQQVATGTTRLKVKGRGIYIVKAGAQTRRITI